ncbi:aryl-sulfate sulfotransferase [Halobaculum sp. MBLA0143]|uniref:aryl-sulfate sulfotransferase n=1 Tax=Halobaculum sp. MBLA0143 TaxID=3079933 RepID=UPI003524B9FE
MREIRRSSVRLTLLVVLVAVAPATAAVSAGAAATVDASAEATTADPGVCVGHQAAPADGVTVVSVQGARFGENGGKEPARLVAFGPRGEVLWVHDSSDSPGVVWSYDVDPLGNGNLFVTATRRGTTLLYELNTTTGDTVWTEELPYTDTHDADPLNESHVVIANMRNYDEADETNEDRLVVYDRVDDEVTWTWQFDDHFDRDVGGSYTDDWTHFNDVDRVGDDFLLSPRNFDQVLLVDRATGEIERQLGSDGNYDVLYEQHNPDYLQSDAGTDTFLVADSENDRIVEYEHTDGDWERTWRLGTSDTLSWPRDADRLRNGHTLVGDSKNHRVVEVTPRGEVVWEVYSPWLVYDVERIPAGGFESDAYADLGGSRGPTTTDLGADGSYELSGSGATPPSESELTDCADALDDHEGGFGSVDLDATASPTGDGTDGGATADGTTDSERTAATTVPPRTDVTTVGGSGESTSGVVTPGLGVVVAAVALAVLAAVGLARRRD